MFTITRPTLPTEEELESQRAHIAPQSWEYWKASTMRDANARIAEYDRALAIANATPEKETFDFEQLAKLYGFDGREPEFIFTQDMGRSYFTDYYLRCTAITTLADYAKYLTALDRGEAE